MIQRWGRRVGLWPWARRGVSDDALCHSSWLSRAITMGIKGLTALINEHAPKAITVESKSCLKLTLVR
jgi:hypothetical protein